MLDSADVYDLVMGLSVLCRSPLIADIAKVVGDLSPPDITHALNRKQLASKLWLLEQLHLHVGGELPFVTVLGGWYGVLSALLLNDPRFQIGQICSVDIDPSCAPVAELLNRRFGANRQFSTKTADMYQLDPDFYRADQNSIVINTSCEHIPDVATWLLTLPMNQLVLLQSNDYRAVPEHISCVDSAKELADKARLSKVIMTGSLNTGKYTRFMVIGRR